MRFELEQGMGDWRRHELGFEIQHRSEWVIHLCVVALWRSCMIKSASIEAIGTRDSATKSCARGRRVKKLCGTRPAQLLTSDYQTLLTSAYLSVCLILRAYLEDARIDVYLPSDPCHSGSGVCGSGGMGCGRGAIHCGASGAG